MCALTLVKRILCLAAFPSLAIGGLPVFDVGSDWEKLGQLAAERIHDFQRVSPTVAKLRKIMKNKNVSEAFDTLWAWHSSAFPDYVKELRDMAKGANVDLSDLALFSLKNELLDVYGQQTPDAEESECSDVLVRNGDNHIDGHNEDGEAELANVSYWVKTDDFEAMAYPGQLPGGAFGFNRHGLVVTMNALSPKDVVIKHGCAGKYWVGRKIMDAETVAQVVDFLKTTCHAYGMSLNVGSTRTGEQVNIEVGPGSGLSVHSVDNASYFHANAYLHLNVTEDPHLSPSSAHRQARAKQLAPANNRSGVLAILGDAGDVRWPIYRTLGHGDYAVTLATALFDFNAYKVDVWSGSNPLTSVPLFTRPLPGKPGVELNAGDIVLI
eukprot:TRINITY_DN31345_c0_g1_i1.p1 TRINITY_DN31345_c0_g1~~TRINITY_DN31345_c0_g1_i1.p1  ORF type:complete len:381 (+),score=54.10 TRINITY_DN31345_c0_g1_i1:47-1189(+)